jgi:hypothetical protein
MQVMSRSSSSDGRSAVRSAPYPPPACNTGIVIRMPMGLHRRLPASRRRRSRKRRSATRRPGHGGLRTGRCWRSSPATPPRPRRRARPITRHCTLAAGARGAAGGAPGGPPVFDISDSDEDVKPNVKMEDDGTGSSSGGRRHGGHGRYGGR